MNISTSEYSSGCESGWTMYLDQLSNSTDHNNHFVTECEEKNDQEDEDLSMVSDATSGPAHYFQEYDDQNNCGGGVYSQYYGYYKPSFSEEKKKSKQKSKTKETIVRGNKKQHNLCLDDTASSPVLDFSQDNVPPSDFSQVLSSAHFEGEYSMTKKHLGFFKSSTKGKSGSLLGRKRQ